MTVLHDSRNILFRTPGGARPAGETVTLRLRAEAGARPVLRVWWNDAEQKYPMKPSGKGADLFEYALVLPKEPGLLWYYFIVESEDGVFFFGNAEDGLGGEGELYDHEPPSFQITVYDPAFAPPAWMRNGIMYQIMPDRFNAVGKKQPEHGWLHESWEDIPALPPADRPKHDNSAMDFFGGNLRGIEEKLVRVDWAKRDVLIVNIPDDIAMASCRVSSSLAVACDDISREHLPVHHVALYQPGVGIDLVGTSCSQRWMGQATMSSR